jgi:hypothetical protein
VPTVDELRSERAELIRRVRALREAHDRGDEIDTSELLNLQSRVDLLGRQIQELGGSLDPPAAGPVATPAGGTPAPSPTPAPAPTPTSGGDAVQQAQARVDALRAGEPHPGVRMGPDGTVVNGTAEQLQDNLNWREELARAEQALAVAQAERAFDAGGGAGVLTAADRTALRRSVEELERLRAEDARIGREIAPLEEELENARRMLDANRGQSGGPSAGTMGAIGAGEAINQRLRPLYQEQARVRGLIARKVAEILDLVKARVRAAIDSGGGVGAIALPSDRSGSQRVETELLRRLLGRLGVAGLESVPADGTGLLGRRSRTGDGRRLRALVPLSSGGCIVALIVVAAVIVAVVVAAVLLGDDTGEVATGSDRGREPVAADPADDGGDSGSADGIGAEPPAAATRAVLAATCGQVVHSPPPASTSLSQLRIAMLLVGLDGVIPDGAQVTVDAGGDAPATATVEGGLAEPVVGISRFARYEQRSLVLSDDGRPIEVIGMFAPLEVGAAEGPIEGCTRLHDLSDAERDQIATQAVGTHHIRGFLDSFNQAHAAGDGAALFDLLDSASVARYGAKQCRSYLEGVAGTFANGQVLAARPAPWSYDTDGASEPVDGAWTVDLLADVGGARQPSVAHFRLADGTVTWFTDCGEPLAP